MCLTRLSPRRPSWPTCGLLALVCLLSAVLAASEDDKPEFSLRASPRVGFAPTEILFVAELTGGADDYEELYCVSLQWDWDDDTRSESTPDCEPYEPGTSKIRRRYSTRHRFNYGGHYEVRVNLKKRDDTVASARATVQLRGRFD